MTQPVSVDEAMNDVRAQVRARLRGEIARLDPGSPLVDPALFDEAEAILHKALERRRRLITPALMLDDSDWALETTLRFTSHRQRTGGVILFVKRRLLLPLMRWLYDYNRENFVRQNQVNDTLMGAVEALVIEVATLRREVDALGARQPPPRTPDAP